MKRSLLALAVLGAFAGAASAQSSVTIYGSIDQAVMKGNGGTATNPGALGTSKAYQLAESHGSRLGFRGNEDLGGGLSAQFLIEHRFKPDTGASTNANQFWAAASYVQLTSAAVGSVYLGRYYTPTFLLANRLDPFGWDGVGQAGSNQYANYCQPDTFSSGNPATCAGTGVRTSNTVGYRTPNLGGFVGTVAGALSEGSQDGRNIAATGTYGAGPLFLGVGYEKNYGGGGANSFKGTGMYQLAGSYDLGITKLIVYGVHSMYGPNGDLKANGLELAAVTPIGGGNLKTAYEIVKPKSGNALSPVFNQGKRQKIGIGYDYFLSKRTDLYADVGAAKEENRTRNTAVALGIRHDF